MFSTREDCVLDGGEVVGTSGDDHARHSQMRQGMSRPQHKLPGFASMSMNVPAGTILSTEAVVEKKTGTHFPETFCHISQRECPNLVGTGARAKRLAGVKNIDVYAMGFYMDTRAAKDMLGNDFGCLPPVSLEHNQTLAERVRDADSIEKTIRIVVTSGLVNQSRFSKGLRESLEPRLRRTGDLAALDAFEALFKEAKFYKGLEMSFTNTKEGSLALRIGNKEVGKVPSPGFTSAFFDLYLGAEPVSPDGKANIAKGLAKAISNAAQ